MTSGKLPRSSPWHLLRYLLAQRVAAEFDRNKALQRGDIGTALVSNDRANETADLLRVFGVES